MKTFVIKEGPGQLKNLTIEAIHSLIIDQSPIIEEKAKKEIGLMWNKAKKSNKEGNFNFYDAFYNKIQEKNAEKMIYEYLKENKLPIIRSSDFVTGNEEPETSFIIDSQHPFLGTVGINLHVKVINNLASESFGCSLIVNKSPMWSDANNNDYLCIVFCDTTENKYYLIDISRIQDVKMVKEAPKGYSKSEKISISKLKSSGLLHKSLAYFLNK